MIDSHPLHSIIIGGDFNSELKGDSPFDSLWNDLSAKCDLTSCDNFISNASSITYTYSHDTLGQRKWNYHFLISRRLVTHTKEHSILNEGENPSDHLPILFSLSIPLSNDSDPPVTSGDKPAKLRWDKLTSSQLLQYANRLSNLVEASHWPLSLSRCQGGCQIRQIRQIRRAMRISRENMTAFFPVSRRRLLLFRATNLALKRIGGRQILQYFATNLSLFIAVGRRWENHFKGQFIWNVFAFGRRIKKHYATLKGFQNNKHGIVFILPWSLMTPTHSGGHGGHYTQRIIRHFLRLWTVYPPRLLSPTPSNSTLKEMLGLTIFKKSKNSTRNSGLFTRTSAPLTEIHVIAKITMSLLRTSSTLSCV